MRIDAGVFRTNGSFPFSSSISSGLLSALGMLCLVAIAGCAAGRKKPEEDYSAWRPGVRTVALAPFRSTTALLAPDRVEGALHDRVVSRLEGVGLRVVDLPAWDELWRRYAGDLGGVFDPSTGEPDELRFETVRDAVYRELVEGDGVDAIVHLEVRVFESYGVSKTPEVCGEPVAVYWPGGWRHAGAFAAPLVRTVCLLGTLVDPAGTVLFERRSPIEGLETYDQQTRAVRPKGERLVDSAQLERAIGAVLKPFAATPAPRATIPRTQPAVASVPAY